MSLIYLSNPLSVTRISPVFQKPPSWSGSHQCAPHRGPRGAERGVLPEGGVHEAAHQTQTGTGDLEDAEDQHAVLVEDEVPVPGHGWCQDSGRSGRGVGELWALPGSQPDARAVVFDGPGCVKTPINR